MVSSQKVGPISSTANWASRYSRVWWWLLAVRLPPIVLEQPLNSVHFLQIAHLSTHSSISMLCLFICLLQYISSGNVLHHINLTVSFPWCIFDVNAGSCHFSWLPRLSHFWQSAQISLNVLGRVSYFSPCRKLSVRIVCLWGRNRSVRGAPQLQSLWYERSEPGVTRSCGWYRFANERSLTHILDN